MKFAKLFELEDGNQLLIQYDFDCNEEELHKLVISSEHNGVSVSMANSYVSKAKAIKELKSYSQQKAEDARRILVQITEDPSILFFK